MLNREVDNFNALMDAWDEAIEEGPDAIRPLFCANPGCEGELMDYSILDGHYECSRCGLRIESQDFEKYLKDVVKGKYDA